MQTGKTDTVRSNGDIGTETSVANSEITNQPSRDGLFEVLSNERRRCALYYLQQHDEAVELADVVDYVSSWQYGKPASEVTSKERMRVYSALHQVHLPKLETVGLIKYDTEDGEIRIQDEIEYARLYLEYDPENDISWSSLYLGLVGIGAALALFSQFSMYPIEWLNGLLLVWSFLLIVGVAACVHAIHERRNKVSVSELFDIEQ